MAGAEAGSAGAFRARLFHASVAPPAESTEEHLKVAYFFRESIKGERRAKRSLTAEGWNNDDDDALALRRRCVVQGLEAFNLSAQAPTR